MAPSCPHRWLAAARQRMIPFAAPRHHRFRSAALVLLTTAGSLLLVPLSGQGLPPAVAAIADAVRMPYVDAQPILERSRGEAAAALRGRPSGELKALWPAWLDGIDVSIRKRVEQGETDTLVNLWLFGTSFTALPPVRAAALAASSIDAADIVERRLDDLLDGVSSPGTNERLQLARDVVQSRNVDPGTPAGRERVRELLRAARARILAENRSTDAALARAAARGGPASEMAAHATIFSERGLSSDTSLLSSFGVEQSLAALKRSGAIAPGSVRRVGVIGPGLDIIDKADGHDFYPPQSVQPFAVIDSLLRLGLAASGELQVTTVDVSRRVNRHLQDARVRAQRGQEYVVHLPLTTRDRWTAALVQYWGRWGDRIGESMIGAAGRPPAGASLSVRAVRVRPSVVTSIHARDLNVVTERIPLPAAERFDLVIATNVLVYYDRFEQSLALANIAAMLRPGGALLSNTGLVAAPPMDAGARYADVVYSDRQFDRFFWYLRQ